MTAREDYIFTQIIEKYNALFLNFQLLVTERDTLLDETKSLKDELLKSYQDLALLKGDNPFTPGMQDLLTHLETQDV